QGNSALKVDRAFVNRNNIPGNPIWFSIVRRPTTDGGTAHTRMGADTRMATPTAYMDWPFDGISMGYAYRWANENMGTGRVRICYGRGFEAGLQAENGPNLNDTDFVGISWDVMKKDDRFAYIQSFLAMDVFNYPAFTDNDANVAMAASMGPRNNVGDIVHTSAQYQDKVGNLTYHATAGWSLAQPDESSMGMFWDPMVGAGTEDENGYSAIIGVRYDMDDMGLKLGAEYNWGSEYWIAMTPGHDDLYKSKLATRGSVVELYGIYDIPSGAAISKYGSAFIRVGYQHYEYDYSGSADWNMKPYDLNNATDVATLAGMGMDPVESADQIYVTFEATF
nr:DUF3373 family protein [Candidatus Desulfatifera sulfidica]